MKSIVCKKCQKIFFARESRNRKYCCRKCFYTSDAKKHLRKVNPNINCAVCNRGFRVKPSWLNSRKYCSVVCRNKGWSIRKKGISSHPATEAMRKRWTEYVVGRPSPMKGRKQSELAKIKMSATRQGIGIDQWKGFKKDDDTLEREKFRKQIQKQVFVRDDYTCQICGSRGGFLQVDHVESWKDHVELRFETNNCRTLCMDCHYLITFGKNKPPDVVWGHNLKYRN